MRYMVVQRHWQSLSTTIRLSGCWFFRRFTRCTSVPIAQVVPGGDDYEAGWGGRGDLTVLPFEGECGHRWALCFGFHKGMTAAFVAVPR